MRSALALVVVASIAVSGAAWWSQRGAPTERPAAARPAPTTALIIGSDHRSAGRDARFGGRDTFRLVRVRPSTQRCETTSTPGTSTLVCIFRWNGPPS
jgi:hypothetical protein